MDSNEPKIKPEPTTEKISNDGGEQALSSKPAMTRGGVKKRTFVPKATSRQDRRVVKEEPADSENTRGERGRRGRPDRGSFSSRGRGRGRGRDNVVMQASGPFSLGPAGIGNNFKRASAVYSGSGGGHSGGGGGGSSYRVPGERVKYEDDEKEEYEDAELMVHFEGGDLSKQDPDEIGSKEDIFAAEVSRQLNGLDLKEDKLSAFVDSFEIGKKEDAPNSANLLLFLQLPAMLPHMFNKSTVKSEAMEESSDDSPSEGKPLDNKPEFSPIEKQSGKVGKLLFYKSGKVQMKFGQVLFDVNTASSVGFHQEIVALDSKNGEAFVLGDVNRRFVCTPNIDSLLGL